MKRVCIALLILCGVASSLCAQILVQHDYDALGDTVKAVALRPGEHLSQSFAAPPRSVVARSVRLKLRRVGDPGPLQFRVGRRLGAADLGSGEVQPTDVQSFFECFVALALPGARLDPGSQYYVQVRLASSPAGRGYYELFGTLSGDEGPINRDYGAHTPTYLGGEAIDTEDRAIAGADFAFQVLGPAGAPAGVEEPFRFVGPLVAKTQYQRIRGAGPPAAAEVALDPSWSLQLLGSRGQASRNAAQELRDYLRQAMGVTLAATGTRLIVAGTTSDLPAYRGRVSVSEAFVLDVGADRVTVAGFDDRGVMRGLYHVQDLMDLRQAPILKLGTAVRSPRYHPRITCAPFYAGVELEPDSDPYTAGLLSKISHAGYDALFVWAKLYELGQSPALPELGAGAPARLARLKALVERAAGFGIDVYLYVTLDPIHPSFFDKHPDARGVARNHGPFYGIPGYLLCTSAPVVQKYIEEATASIFRAVPALRGAIMIPYGEGLYSCRIGGPNTCQRCANRSRDDVLAELVTLVYRGARSAAPRSDIVAWTYTWPASDPSRAQLIRKLPKDVTWQATFEKEGIVEKDGVLDPAYDYSISYLGPAENLRLQLPLVEKAGMPLWVKTESMISQEFIQAPYIPVYQRWIERYRRIAETPRVSGLFMNWNHYGFMPSRVSELVKWFTWDPLPDGTELLRQIASRDFGDAATPYFMEAWEQLGAAISHFPFSDGTSRAGPLPKGPAHPFFWNPEYRPEHHDKRQFFNNLNWTLPWDVESTRLHFERMEREWAGAVLRMHLAVAATSEAGKADAQREAGLAALQLGCVRSVLNLIEFYQLRFELTKSREPAAVLRGLTAVLRREKENASQALTLVEADSRLGFANGGNGITNGGVRAGIFTAASIRKKLAHLQQVLDHDVAQGAARGR